MIYAPNLSNADIGVTPELLKQYPTMPFIAYSGPHGYLVMVTDPVHLRGLLRKPKAQR